MTDENYYDSESEADTGPMPVPVELVEQQAGRVHLIVNVPLPASAAADGAASESAPPSANPAPSAAAAVAGGTINIAGKVRRGEWSVIKPSGDGASSP